MSILPPVRTDSTDGRLRRPPPYQCTGPPMRGSPRWASFKIAVPFATAEGNEGSHQCRIFHESPGARKFARNAPRKHGNKKQLASLGRSWHDDRDQRQAEANHAKLDQDTPLNGTQACHEHHIRRFDSFLRRRSRPNLSNAPLPMARRARGSASRKPPFAPSAHKPYGHNGLSGRLQSTSSLTGREHRDPRQ
jgi:hypothetical protein